MDASGAPVARYHEGEPAEGYQMGAPLVYCAICGMNDNADRNATLMIGNRLFARYDIIFEEKPPTLPATERTEQSAGVVALQEPNVQAVGQLSQRIWHESSNGHGTAQNGHSRLVEPVRAFTSPLLPPMGGSYAPITRGTDYTGESEAAGL